jgi:hypothetical protein
LQSCRGVTPPASRLVPPLALVGLLLAAPTAFADELPSLDPMRPISCHVDGAGQRWRVQCEDHADGKPGRCLEAPDGEIGGDGKILRPLERASSCSIAPFDRAAMATAGYKFVRAQADAPPGWMRDDRGRIFQVTFDLHRRLYAGVAWAPTLSPAGGGDGIYDRLALEVGLLEIDLETGDSSAGVRHRIRLVEGSMRVAPFAADLTVARYDLSRRRSAPLFRLTTFFGTPKRYDIDAHLGLWFEVGHLQTASIDEDRAWSLVRWATAHVTWDLWRSERMDSYVRLRGGAGGERLYQDGHDERDAIVPGGAIEGDLTLSDSGFDRLTALAQFERPIYYGRNADDGPGRAKRWLGRVGYERILVAVNDQPITLSLTAEAERRDDLADAPDGWDFRALAGLRFSLWAPPR